MAYATIYMKYTTTKIVKFYEKYTKSGSRAGYTYATSDIAQRFARSVDSIHGLFFCTDRLTNINYRLKSSRNSNLQYDPIDFRWSALQETLLLAYLFLAE
jgi:hypothetical protein